MNNGLSRKYIVISLLVHLSLFLIMAYVIHSNRIAKPFVVFGAHSKKPSHAIMKFGNKRAGGRGAVPFVGGGRKGGKRGGRGRHRENRPRNSSKQMRSAVEKAPKVRVKKSAPLAVKQAVVVPEKLVAMRSGVSIQKEIRAKKLKQKQERAARKREERRLAREERELRKLEKLLAKQEEEERLQEQARKMQREKELAKIEKKEKKKKKELLLAQCEKDVLENNENKKNNEIEPDEHEDEPVGDSSPGDLVMENSETSSENGAEVLEFNLLDQSDPEMRVYHRNIQREVARLWRPPIGVPKGTTCRMMITLGADGSVERAEFVSRSKMLIYDLSVLRIINQLELDKFLWGKRLIIDFCQ